MSVQQIPRVAGLSREEFYKNYVEQNRPVVLKDAASDWPAISKWTSEYLARNGGDQVVQLWSIDPQKPPAHSYLRAESTLREYIARLPVAARGDPYLAEQPLKKLFPDLLADIGTMRYSRSHPSNLSIMLSSRSVAALHYHPHLEAISHQIAGTRHFILLPPTETSRLDPGPVMSPLWNFGRRVIKEDEIESMREEVFETTLTSGEAIYIPLHWWHTVFAGAGLSILVCDFFEYPHVRPPQSEISDRVEQMHAACRESIAACEASLQRVSGVEDKIPYFEHIISCCRAINDKKKEQQVLIAALSALPETAGRRSEIQSRLDELASGRVSS